MFELRINGQRVWSSERQVTRVSMQSGRGEIGAAGISPADGVIDIFVEEVAPGGPPRLDQVEEAQARLLADVAEGTETGSIGYTPANDANKPMQGVQERNADVPPGGPDVGDAPELLANRPESLPTGSVLNEDGSVDTGVLDEGTSDPRVNPPRDGEDQTSVPNNETTDNTEQTAALENQTPTGGEFNLGGLTSPESPSGQTPGA